MLGLFSGRSIVVTGDTDWGASIVGGEAPGNNIEETNVVETPSVGHASEANAWLRWGRRASLVWVGQCEICSQLLDLGISEPPVARQPGSRKGCVRFYREYVDHFRWCFRLNVVVPFIRAQKMEAVPRTRLGPGYADPCARLVIRAPVGKRPTTDHGAGLDGDEQSGGMDVGEAYVIPSPRPRGQVYGNNRRRSARSRVTPCL